MKGSKPSPDPDARSIVQSSRTVCPHKCSNLQIDSKLVEQILPTKLGYFCTVQVAVAVLAFPA